MHPRVVIAVDPGTAKCGLAVVEQSGPGGTPAVLHREITETAQIATSVSSLFHRYTDATILVGDATGSRATRAALAAALPPDTVILPVPEAFTSARARVRYLRENPPRNPLARLLPLGLRTPDKPYDDLVAVLLAEDYLLQT